MKRLNNIFDIISKENIIYEETNLEYEDGVYFNIPGIPITIGINKSIISINSIYISTLAEELGHHFTTASNLLYKSNLYSEILQKNKKEKIAKRWASNFLISDSDFVQALNDCIISIPEMAEYFDVSEEIINYKIYSIILDEPKYNTIRNNFKTREIPYNSCEI